ncbi:hypothetical protein P3342_007251 [Pyrenophora teres f. teres]|nr:hypothetical protein P3342_007251 [Pyrenophora teres f. teres]
MKVLAGMVLDALSRGDTEAFKKLKKSFADTAIKARRLRKVASVKFEDDKRKSMGLKPKDRARGKKTAFGQWFENLTDYYDFLFDYLRRRARNLADDLLDCILDAVWAGLGGLEDP